MSNIKHTLKSKFKILLFFSLFICLLVLSGCGKKEPISQSGVYFDTVISVTLYDSPDEQVLQSCFEQAKTFEGLLSKTVEGSDIWNLNHAGGLETEVSSCTYTLLGQFMEYAKESEGKLDPTIGSVSGLWDFHDSGENTSTLPSPASLTEALSHVNYRNVEMRAENPDTSDARYYVTLSDPGAQLDLGCIAKGYIADLMKENLVKQGVKSALINLGGNVLTIGNKPDKSPFKVGIKRPFAEDGDPILVLPISDRSMVTSGIYERYFEYDGKLYHHILDSETGYPIDNSLSSVTILSDSSLDGDALSTYCFILGLDKGLSYIESLDDIEAIFITKDEEIYKTSGL